MDKALLVFGILIIFLGVLFFYLILTSAINLGRSIKGQSKTLPQLQQNEIYIFTPLSAVVVLIGVFIIREAFRR